jgi:3',5'-cyclic AMP phosphodiesterase CpdA
MATGRLGHEQRAGLGKILQQLAAEDLFRVLLIHHPPVTSPGRWAARLRDSRDLLELIARYGVDLVLHGHDHRHATVWLDGPRGRIRPSACRRHQPWLTGTIIPRPTICFQSNEMAMRGDASSVCAASPMA